MSLSDELTKLDELHRRGGLSDAEFARAKARVLGYAGPSHSGSGAAVLNTFQRSRVDRWVAGVCGGLAERTGVAAWIWRMIFALSVLCAGTGIAIYVLLWIFVPDAPDRLGSGPRELA